MRCGRTYRWTGCTDIAPCSESWAHSLPSGPGRAASPICSDLICDRHTIIITGALELRTNQITHFYSERKNTDEMIKMVNILRRQYGSKKKIYISWDAAGWHISKALGKHVEFLNGWAEHERAPIIELAPLPSRAQFLNVIDSVFSGMSRAIIHNS